MRTLIIIVTYNGMQWLAKCLQTASMQSLPVDLFLVDNNSTDGTPDYIRKNYPGVTLISSPENLGFGRANNLGLKHALEHNYDYAFLLNQDAYLNPDTIERLIEVHRLNRGFGVLSPMQYNGQGDALDHNFQLNFESSSNCSLFKDAVLPAAAQGNLYAAHFIMAAMWLVSRDCLQRVGLFDPIFNHYGEDNDYLNRLRFHRFKVGILDSCIGFHDRASRQVDAVKALGITFAGYRATLTDINRTTKFAFLLIMKIIAIRLVKAILHGDFKIAWAMMGKTFTLFANSRRILHSRKINASLYQNADV